MSFVIRHVLISAIVVAACLVGYAPCRSQAEDLAQPVAASRKTSGTFSFTSLFPPDWVKGNGILSILYRANSDAEQRMEALIFDGENMRRLKKEWNEFWKVDQLPMQYQRIHGGIGPE